MLGRYLRLVGLYLFFSIAALLCATAKERPNQVIPIKGMVRFELYRGYLMVATGSVGPLKDLHFLIDTGTSTTLLDLRIARALKVEGAPEEVDVMFFEGREHAARARVPSIALGPIRQSHVPVLIEDLSILDDALPVHIDAVIGLDVLGGSRFEVDYRRRRIYFGQPSHLPVSLPLSMENGLAMVNVQVNHTSAHMLLDTGTPSMLIFGARIPKAIAGLKVRRPQSGAATRGSGECREVHVPKLQLGEVEFTSQRAIVMENRDEGGRDFDGLLSPAALGIDAFAIDLEQGALELRLGM